MTRNKIESVQVKKTQSITPWNTGQASVALCGGDEARRTQHQICFVCLVQSGSGVGGG